MGSTLVWSRQASRHLSSKNKGVILNLYQLCETNGRRFGQHPAILDGRKTVTYEELDRAAREVGQWFQRCGVKAGDRVGVCLPNSIEWVFCMLGVSWAGGIFVPISPVLKLRQVRQMVGSCGIRLLTGDSQWISSITTPRVGTGIQSVARYSGPDIATGLISISVLEDDQAAHEWATIELSTLSDLAAIIHTSGSTGLSKGVMLSSGNLIAGARLISGYLGNNSTDRVLCALPLSFTYGLSQLTTMLYTGGTAVMQRSLLPGELVKTLIDKEITGLAGVPTFWRGLLRSRESIVRRPFDQLRYVTNSGGTITSKDLADLQRLLPDTSIYLMYGTTEALRSTYLPPEEIARGPTCIGRPIPETSLWIVDEDGRECAADEVGELVHRGPTVAMGYWNDPLSTDRTFRWAPRSSAGVSSERIAYSGDLVRKDSSGLFYFVSRRDEVLKVAGYRVGPEEVEDILLGIDAVREAVVFGEEDQVLGERVVAAVAIKNGFNIRVEEIRAECASLCPFYMVPSEIHYVEGLPKTASGKVDRARVKRRFLVPP